MENEELIKKVVEELCCVDGVVDLDAVAKGIIALVREHDGWVSVDTAPKDGTKILLLLEDDRIESGRWIEKEEDQVDSMGHDAGWITDSGWTFPGRSFGNPDYYSEPCNTPAHWKPLPAPPTTEKE